MRETQFSEPGACDHYHTAMWPVKGQQSAVPGSGCPWGVSFPGQGLGLASLWSKEQQRHPGQRTSVLLALAKKRWKAGKGAAQKSAGGGGLASRAWPAVSARLMAMEVQQKEDGGLVRG